MSGTANAAALRACVSAVHNPAAPQPERLRAQAQLDAFARSPAAWRSCFALMRAAREPAVLAFLLGVLERTLVDRGEALAPGERGELRGFVLQFAVSAQRAGPAAGLPRFLATKAAKILVDAAKLDWPRAFPDFFDQVLGLCGAADAALRPLGAQALLITVEEFLATSARRGRDVPLTNARRVELRAGINGHLGRILPALTALLRAGDPGVCRQVLGVLRPLFSNTAVRGVQEHVDAALMDQLFALVGRPADPNSPAVVGCLAQMVGRNCIPRDAEAFVLRVSTQMMTVLQAVCVGAGGGVVTAVSEEFLEQLVQFLAVFLERHLGRVERQPNFPLTQLLALLFRFSFVLPTPDTFVASLSVWSVFVDFVVSGKADARRRAMYTQGLLQLAGKLMERMLFSRSAQFLSVLVDVPSSSSTGSGGGGSASRGGSTAELDAEDAEHEGKRMWAELPVVRTELDEYLDASFALVRSLSGLPQLGEQLLSTVLPALQAGSRSFVAAAAPNKQTTRDLSTLCALVSAASGHFLSPQTFGSTAPHASGAYVCLLEVAFHILQHRSWSRGHAAMELLLQVFRSLGQFSPWLGLCLKMTRGAGAGGGTAASSAASSASPPPPFQLPPPQAQQYLQQVVQLLDRTAQLVSVALGGHGPAAISPAPEVLLVTAVQLARSVLTRAKPSSELAGRMYRELLAASVRSSLPQAVRERTAACVAEVVLTGIGVRAANANCESDEIRAQFSQFVQPSVAGLVGAAAQGSAVGSDLGLQNRVRGSAGNLAAVSWSRRNAPRAQKRVVFAEVRPALEATGTLLHLCLTPQQPRARRRQPPAQQRQQQPPRPLTTLGGMRTAKQLVTFLRFATDGLRNEIGVDTLCQVVMALCQHVKQYLLGGLATGTVVPSATLLSLLVSVLRLFSVAVNDPSKKFRRVLPHVLGAVSEFDGALFAPQSPVRQALLATRAGQEGLDDVLAARFALFRVGLLQHWSYFCGTAAVNKSKPMPPGAAAPRGSKAADPVGRAFFEASMNEVLRGFGVAAQAGGAAAPAGAPASARAVAPDQVRYNVRTLRELHRVHGMFNVCVPALRAQCLTACLRLLASSGMELLRDDIIPLVHSIAAFDFQGFFRAFLPQYVESVLAPVPGANDAFHKQKLCAQFAQDADAVSFAENALNFSNLQCSLVEGGLR